MLSHTIFNTFKKCNQGDGNIVKNDGGGEMVVVFIFSGKPIFRYGASHYVYIFMVLSSLTALLALFLA